MRAIGRGPSVNSTLAVRVPTFTGFGCYWIHTVSRWPAGIRP